MAFKNNKWKNARIVSALIIIAIFIPRIATSATVYVTDDRYVSALGDGNSGLGESGSYTDFFSWEDYASYTDPFGAFARSQSGGQEYSSPGNYARSYSVYMHDSNTSTSGMSGSGFVSVDTEQSGAATANVQTQSIFNVVFDLDSVTNYDFSGLLSDIGGDNRTYANTYLASSFRLTNDDTGIDVFSVSAVDLQTFAASGLLQAGRYTMYAGATAYTSGTQLYSADFDFNLQLSEVPVPAAVWLFGSGLIGLIGVARRKKA